MKTEKFTVGPFAENTYLLSAGDEALLIDPGFYQPDEFQSFEQRLESWNTKLTAVVLTHAHVDHVLGLDKVVARFDVPVFYCDKDRYLWDNYRSQAQMFGFQVEGFDFEPEPLAPQEDWEFGSFLFDVLYTPGHAPDHISLYSKQENILIAGDTLFREGIGRTDLYKGSFELLQKTIRETLYALPEDTRVLPGHGPETTIGHEKKANPFVKGKPITG
ncbi:MAG: MBL fold metallo-hydrolase [Balneolaceae bacterium]|nr:MBL fold metallo-hydrolase [Balneolaceae bacterium]